MLIILCKTYFETTYYYLFCHFKDHTRNKITVLAKEYNNNKEFITKIYLLIYYFQYHGRMFFAKFM